MTLIFALLGLWVLTATDVALAQPANDDCADATVIGALPSTDTVDTTAAATEPGDPSFDCDGLGERPATSS